MASERIFYAHSLPPPSTEAAWEPLDEHLIRVADGHGQSLPGASKFAEAFGAAEWGRLLGLWHDIGKYSTAFQGYLRASAGSGAGAHSSEMTGRVDHSTAGAQHAVRLGPAGRLLAYCIAGHHAGLPDNEGSDAGLARRLEKQVEPIDAAPAHLLSKALLQPPTLRLDGDRGRGAFALAFFTRMLFSCLVDADFLATEWFMSPERASRRLGAAASMAQLLARLDRHLGDKQRRADDTEVNHYRREVLAKCREKARHAPGLFSLNVPTGGGKTLSSLAFALTHAVEHRLRRVVYAIPFTSIIEQTADVFRDAMGDLDDEVLEHHSNLEPDDPARQSDRSRLAAENFDAPLVVTTNVQLFESLFASRTSRCRKLHRLAKSVIILDEAQTLPPNLLAPTLAALDELVRNYGASVVLCTATQPAVERRDRFSIGLTGVRPIIDEPRSLHEALRRTRVERVGTLKNDEVAERLRAERQTLCIVNSRRHAADLFRSLDDPDALHLSASMCAAHRSDVVAEIRRRLDPRVDVPCRVISTQVIEAGVDVDFPAVFRAVAGLDSIAQAAGRCNREGRLSDEYGRPCLGRVMVFDYDAREYSTDTLIARGAAHFREIASDYVDDLLSPAAVEAYFRLHYWQQGGDDGRGWDRGREGASVMACFAWDGKTGLHAQFRTAAEAYRLIDDAQTPILVPYGARGRDLIRELEGLPADPEPKRLRAFDRAAQRYVVGIYDRAFRTLYENQVLIERHGRYVLANDAAYDPRLGLTFEARGFDPEALIL
jgi:CRISPR-associated endonuclease/helicase Cas3